MINIYYILSGILRACVTCERVLRFRFCFQVSVTGAERRTKWHDDNELREFSR